MRPPENHHGLAVTAFVAPKNSIMKQPMCNLFHIFATKRYEW
ncbi:hypothetical protein HMPREF1870_01539 [Bacteroidales bacterium KA00344]|nr:hypothetical protein HMPREF1870_01539 [Bacteroidales bacterium KA00344]